MQHTDLQLFIITALSLSRYYCIRDCIYKSYVALFLFLLIFIKDHNKNINKLLEFFKNITMT